MSWIRTHDPDLILPFVNNIVIYLVILALVT